MSALASDRSVSLAAIGRLLRQQAIMLAILAVAAASAAPPCGTTRPPKPHSVLLANEKDKLLVAAVAKGGATVATQLMLRREGLLETALRHRGSHGTGWIHDYRHVYARQPNHRPPRNATATCRDRAWTCVVILRSPLDRVVSSYQHAMARDRCLKSHAPSMRASLDVPRRPRARGRNAGGRREPRPAFLTS